MTRKIQEKRHKKIQEKRHKKIQDKWWPELRSAIRSEKSPLWANDSSGGWELKNKLAHTEEVHIGVVDGEVHLFDQVGFILATFFFRLLMILKAPVKIKVLLTITIRVDLSTQRNSRSSLSDWSQSLWIYHFALRWQPSFLFYCYLNI